MEQTGRWMVYVLVSTATKRTYVGITVDIKRRIEQHNGCLRGGARSTRSGRPWQLGASYGPFDSRGEALRVEHAVRQRRGAARLSACD